MKRDFTNITKTSLFGLLICLLLSSPVFSQTANILVTPASSTIMIGQSFTVNVRVDIQTGSCNAAEVHLNFITAYLTITNITRPSSATFTSETLSLPAPPYTTVNTTGHLEYAAGIPSGSTAADFDILAITFTTPASSPQTGTTAITLQNTPGHRTRAALNGTPLTSTLTDGSATIQNVSLPVTLVNLSASPAGKKVTLNWSTASENNNRGFDIQRSTDGMSWTTIGFVAGAGNSNFTKNYSYVDDNLEARKYYYRLNQMDIDGRSKYSVVVSAVIGTKAEYVLGQNYPNPFRNETTIQYILPQAGQVNLSLFDISGRTVRVLVSGSNEAGTHAIVVNTGSLTKGIYYYRLQAGDFTDVKKLTIQ
jgi:hypothetical protein